MNTINVDSYEIKTSRTEQKVPVVNGVHLHSIYNPFKEAETLIESHKNALEKKSEVLILGLGFAYHVNEIIETLKKFHGDNFKIVVIEPNIQVYNDCIDLGLLNKKNVLVYSGFTPKELYSDIDLVHFLLRKPTVIAHPPSFNLYQIYFKTFLTFEAPDSLKESFGFLTNATVVNYLQQFDENNTFANIIQYAIPEKSIFTEMDFMTMALAEIINTAKKNEPINKNGDV
jgi:hypothetical protein